MTDFVAKSNLFQKIIKDGKGTVSDKFWDTLQILYVLGELVPSKKPDNPGPDFVPTYARFKNNGKLTVLTKNKAGQSVQSKELTFTVFFINLITFKESSPQSCLGDMMNDMEKPEERELFCRSKLYEVLKKVPLVQLVGRTDDYFKSACEVIFKKSYAEVHADLFDCFEPSALAGVAQNDSGTTPVVESDVAASSSAGQPDDTESDEDRSENAEPPQSDATAPPQQSPQPRQPSPPPAPSQEPNPEPRQPSPLPASSQEPNSEPRQPSPPPAPSQEPNPEPRQPSPPPAPSQEPNPELRPGTPPTPPSNDPPEPRQPLEDLPPLVDALDGLDLPALMVRFSLPAEADVLPRCFGVREPPRVPVPLSDFPELSSLQVQILDLKSQRCPDRVAQAQAKIALRLGPHQELAAQQVWHLASSPLTGYKAALCLPPGKGKTLVSLAFAEMGDFRLVIVVAHNAEGKVNWGRQLSSVRDARVVLAESGGFKDTQEAFLAAQEMLEASEGKVYVVLTPESLSSVQHTCLINEELSHWKSCLIVDEPHLNFKDPSHHMANHLAKITRFTEHWAIPCVFVTGTLCSKPEDACNWLSGVLFSRHMPLGCQCKDAPGIAQAVLRLLEVRMEDARPSSEVPEGVIYDINVVQPDNLDPDADMYKQQWWFAGLDLEDIHAVKYALVGACALWKLGHGSVFFVNNVKLIDSMKEALRAPCMGDRFRDFFFMHGEMKDDERRSAYEGFLEKGGVLVITPAIGGIGLNFTSRAGEHLVKAVFLLCPEFDKEALLQLLGRAARTPNELRGVMFKLVNTSKELRRVNDIIYGKQQGSQHNTGERLVRLQAAGKRKRLSDDDEDDRASARKVLKLQDAPAVVAGLFYAAQCGEAINTKTAEFWVNPCSPLQPPPILADAKKRVADLKRKLATAETLEEAVCSLRPRVEPRVEQETRVEPRVEQETRVEPRVEQETREEPRVEQETREEREDPTLHVPTSPKLPPPDHRLSSPMAQQESDERKSLLDRPRRVPLNEALAAAGIAIPNPDGQSLDDSAMELLAGSELWSVPPNLGRSSGKSEFSLWDEEED